MTYVPLDTIASQLRSGTATAAGLMADAAARHGATYVNLFQERADDPFARRPELNARDGLHPSDAGYRVWFAELDSQADLGLRLAAARGP